MAEQEKDLSSLENKDLAIAVLREVAADRAAPAQSRQAAARSIAEIVGLLGKNSEPERDLTGKALSDMTAAELDAEINRLSRKSAG